MTVSYTYEVATANFATFWRLLARWRGSIWKLLWKEALLYFLLHTAFRFMSEFLLDTQQKAYYASVVLYLRSTSTAIPLSFVLGFYVNLVMSRWWKQYVMIPRPDSLAVFVSSTIHGLDVRGRLMRRTLMRYVNLAKVITMSMITPRVKRRFPTYDHLVEAGLMTSGEKTIFDKLKVNYTVSIYWVPLIWAGAIVTRARKEGRIRDDYAAKTLYDAIVGFRSGLGGLLGYDSISIPLVYTQVVTMSVYSYFMVSLIGSQFVDDPREDSVDLYIPWFTVLRYLLFVGWMKVAEALVNPFGDDDDNFEVNWLIDRDTQVSYLIVDGMHNEHPELIEDKYWEEVLPTELPYTVASEDKRDVIPEGSTATMNIKEKDQLFVLRETEPSTQWDVENNVDGTGGSHIEHNKIEQSRRRRWNPISNARLWTFPKQSVTKRVTNFLCRLFPKRCRVSASSRHFTSVQDTTRSHQNSGVKSAWSNSSTESR